ncbi:hypothetical protein LTR17_001143 [Elasticomyces elasticus]|nr:hypothetical protein LTR17_001143 [Elasticomyces elasticus]
MASRSPRDRLQKLFHKQHDSKDARRDEPASTSSPPASPSSAGGLSKHVRKTSSNMSLRNLVHGKASNRHAKSDSRSASGNAGDRTPPNQFSSPRQSTDAPPVAPAQRENLIQRENVNAVRREAPVYRDAPAYRDAPIASSTQPAAQLAATKAMYPDQDLRLPKVPHQSDLSSDLQHLTLSDAAGREPYAEDVADRNIGARKPVQSGANRPVSDLVQNYNGSPRQSQDMPERSFVQHGGRPANEVPQPLRVHKRGSIDDGRNGSVGSPITPVTSHGLNHKANVNDLRKSSDVARSRDPQTYRHEPKKSMDADPHRVRRSSLAKPLPPRPSDDLEKDRQVHFNLGTGAAATSHPGYTTELADKAIDLTGIVDLSKTEDATLHERWAPAVTHEKVIQNVHYVREELITREIHNHHVFHRVLPIIDIEVLPARHFIPVEGGYAEIAEEEIPGKSGSNAQWIIAEMVSKGLPRSKGPIVPERFTARRFDGKDGDYKEYTTADGIKRTETTWVHPPTYYEPGAIQSGQTYPFYIGSPDHDGLTARLPQGKVIGVSPLLAKQREEQANSMGTRTHGGVENAPPVPQHKVFPADLVDSARSGPTSRGL